MVNIPISPGLIPVARSIRPCLNHLDRLLEMHQGIHPDPQPNKHNEYKEGYAVQGLRGILRVAHLDPFHTGPRWRIRLLP